MNDDNRKRGNPHPRWYRFEPARCTEAEISEFHFIVFQDDRKFRSHAVLHLLDLDERTAWKAAVKAADLNQVMEAALQALERIGCPLLRGRLDEDCGRCDHYVPCSSAMQALEGLYLEAVTNVIRGAVATPRYALFFSRVIDQDQCWLLGDVPIVAKLSRIGRAYNVMTCYRPLQHSLSSWHEIRLWLRRRIDLERAGWVCWCDEHAWGLDPAGEKSAAPAAKGGRSPRKRKQPYHRGGRSEWKDYLDEWVE